MGLLTIIRKVKRREKEIRILMVGLDNAGKQDLDTQTYSGLNLHCLHQAGTAAASACTKQYRSDSRSPQSIGQYYTVFAQSLPHSQSYRYASQPNLIQSLPHRPLHPNSLPTSTAAAMHLRLKLSLSHCLPQCSTGWTASSLGHRCSCSYTSSRCKSFAAEA